MDKLLQTAKQCTICQDALPHQPRPIFSITKQSKIIVVGQAPGRLVHETGIAWNDASGKRLREWLGVTDEQFYNPNLFGILPMGFCYPGKGKSGDLPPRKECAPEWHQKILEYCDWELMILIGSYAQKYYLKKKKKKTLTATVREFNHYLPAWFVLPHPSPRNNRWLAKNPWFKTDVLPVLKTTIASMID